VDSVDCFETSTSREFTCALEISTGEKFNQRILVSADGQNWASTN